MKVKVTKTMAKEIKKQLNSAKYCVSDVKYHEMPRGWYERCVGSVWQHEEDYNDATGDMKVIEVLYKDECYAPVQYLTTYDLHSCYHMSDGTYNGFFKAVNDAIAI